MYERNKMMMMMMTIHVWRVLAD